MDKEIQLINGKLQIAKSLTQKQHDAIIEFIKDFFKDKEGPSILGISGGKDSTICAALLAEALGPERVIGVQMPNGEQADIEDSDKVFEVTGIRKMKVNIDLAYKGLCGAIAENYMQERSNEWPSLFTTNTPARLRMVVLYGIAAIEKGSVCNTCNFSEDFVGYSTKYGDCCGDFSLLNQLTKTEVVALGDYIKLPNELVHKDPSDGMCGATDEDNMGFTYDELDSFIRKGLHPKNYNKIKKMHLNPNTKLKLVPMAHPELDLEENWKKIGSLERPAQVKENFKGYKDFRNEILDWAKKRFLDTVKIIYNPDDDAFLKAFKIEWSKDPKCKDISLEIFTHPSFKEKGLVPVGDPILTGKDSKLDSGPKYGELLPPYRSLKN